MDELISFLTSKEIIVVYIVVAIACVLCFAIYLIDKTYYKRKQRHNTKELKKLVEEVNEIIGEESESSMPIEVFNTPIMEQIEPVRYTAKNNNLPEAIGENNSIINIVETVKEEENDIIEEPEVDVEVLEPINIEEIVLDTMPEVAEEITKEIVEPAVQIEEELEYTTIEPNKEEAQEELMRLAQELEKAEQEQKNIDLTSYEEEQEENAIISLEELIKKSKEMYEANEITQYEDEGNEPISLADLENRMNKVQEEVAAIESKDDGIITTEIKVNETAITENFDIDEIIPALSEAPPENLTPIQMVLDDFNSIKIEPSDELKQESTIPVYQTTKKFERSPIISPIYGIERSETKEDIELENTANYEKLDEEIKKTNEFLMTLRELQKNLD